MKTRRRRNITDTIKASETISFLSAENKRLKRENKRLRRLLSEGLTLIERLEKLLGL